MRRFGRSSFAVGTALRLEGRTIEEAYLLDESEYAPHGGAFPVTVKGVGVVGTVAVSGLPQEDDHAFVVTVLREFLNATERLASGGAAGARSRCAARP